MNAQERWKNRIRGIGCVFFLLLLATCGYVGARQEEARSVSVSVTRSPLQVERAQGSSADASLRLESERNREIALLQEVISKTVDEETRENAAVQLSQVAKRMELEAMSTACLEHMGYDGALAVCGAQMMTIMIPIDNMQEESDSVKVIDAVSALTGLDAADIKIILTKK